MATPQPSRLVLDATGDRVFRATGTIDSHTADDLLTTLRSVGTDAEVTLDLSGVDFIDSSGLRSLVTSHQELESGGARLVLSGTSDAVDRLLEITGLQDHLHVI